MNIYLNVEISVRELDSKLLLGVLAAARGHEVLISDMSGIDRGFRSQLLSPGIFHTKCITPLSEKIDFHQALIDRNYVITSIDEEAGLDTYGYEQYSKIRYSDKSINQSSAVFTWGDDDTNGLKKSYPRHIKKIYKTGSARVDLWRSFFSKYWSIPQKTVKKPFVLVSSNMGRANYIKPFYELIKFNKAAGYYRNDPDLLRNHFGAISEDYLKTYSFIEALTYLANNTKSNFDIVFRPHPTESIESWKVYLENIPNVHIIKDGPISSWINSSFAVIHSGCTSAIEATISKKPVISYVPFKMNCTSTLTNELGHRVEKKEQLVNIVNNLFNNLEFLSKKKIKKNSPELLLKKIYLDESEFASHKIIKIWEKFDNYKLSKPSKWKLFQYYLKFADLKQAIGLFLRSLFPYAFRHFREDYKFSPLNGNEIFHKVNKLIRILKIDKKLECKILCKRAILIRKL